jgi:uracil-DNA glycosylase
LQKKKGHGKEMTPSERLEVLKSLCNKCKNCVLGHTRKNLVFGEGPVTPKFMSIAESPGAEEDATGRPFQGRSGKLYRQLLMAIGLDPEKDVYMTNIILCRPPKNRPPADAEINECVKFLKKQVEIIQPRFILLLGRTAVKGLFPEFSKIPMDALRKDSKENKMFYQGIPVLVTYHPSALLRDPSRRIGAQEDFTYLKSLIGV